MLKPVVMVALCEAVSEHDDGALRSLSVHSGDIRSWEHTFWLAPGTFVFSDLQEVVGDGSEVSVLQDVVFVSSKKLCSGSEWERFEDFATKYPVSRQHTASDKAPLTVLRPKRSVLAENPWLVDILGCGMPGGGGGKHVSDVSGEGYQTVDNVTSEFNPEEVFERLASALEALVPDAHPGSASHFSRSLRGGCWARKHKGVDYGSCRAWATTGSAKRFLRDHGLPLSATFSLARFGEQHCVVFCKYWCEKMKFLGGGGALPVR